MKPKEWLLANGHITEITRGRMSRENIARIEGAVASGVAIEGYAVAKAKPAKEVQGKSVPERPATVEKVATGSVKTIADIGEPLRDEKALTAYHVVEGKHKPVGMRTVDENCGNSLTYCGCQFPRVRDLDSEDPVMVLFKPRK